MSLMQLMCVINLVAILVVSFMYGKLLSRCEDLEKKYVIARERLEGLEKQEEHSAALKGLMDAWNRDSHENKDTKKVVE